MCFDEKGCLAARRSICLIAGSEEDYSFLKPVGNKRSFVGFLSLGKTRHDILLDYHGHRNVAIVYFLTSQ